MTMTLNKGFWMPLFPIPTDNLLAWFDASNDAGVIKSFNQVGSATASGTAGNNFVIVSAGLGGFFDVGQRIRLGSDVYTVLSGVGTTWTFNETLVNTYVNVPLEGEFVSQWNDKSGNGNHLTQPTLNNRPTFAFNKQNHNSAVSFNVTGRFIVPSSLYSNIGNTDLTIFASTISDNQLNDRAIFGAANGANVINFGYDSTTIPTGGVSFTHALATDEAAVMASNTAWVVLRGRRQGTLQAIARNNSAETTNNNAINISPTSAFVGNSVNLAAPLTGNVMELIIYNASLNAAQISQVEQYMAFKAGVTLL